MLGSLVPGPGRRPHIGTLLGLALLPACVAMATEAQPPARHLYASGALSQAFVIDDHAVGQASPTHEMLGLFVTLEIRRTDIEISGRIRSEICARFENRGKQDWSGAYLLTDRHPVMAQASLRVAAGSQVRRCETLNPQESYPVLLRQDPR